MQGYNVIAVFSPDKSKILMCKRANNPFKGLYNMVGGKIEQGEDGYDAAYRELFEETGIKRGDIRLVHLMDFSYLLGDYYIEIYGGRLIREKELREEKNPLQWMSAGENFFDMSRFAGTGNIGHILEQVKLYEAEIFGEGGSDERL